MRHNMLQRAASFVLRRPEVDVDAYWQDGFTIVRGVYSADEINRFRRAAGAVGTKGDLLSTPGVNEALLDGRLVGIARTILGSDEVMYAGDGSFTVNGVQHGFHKDNADRDDPHAPDWRDPYTIIRFGIYLQDHVLHSGGVNLRVGSHKTTALDTGRNRYLRTRVGDVALWNLRATHSGNAIQLLFPWWIHPLPGNKGVPTRCVAARKAKGDRIAIFAALGLDDAHHDRYVRYLKSRAYMVDVWRRSSYDDNIMRRAAEIGLKVRNVPEELLGDEQVGQNKTWAALPY